MYPQDTPERLLGECRQQVVRRGVGGEHDRAILVRRVAVDEVRAVAAGVVAYTDTRAPGTSSLSKRATAAA